jgi:hypothetical protein
VRLEEDEGMNKRGASSSFKIPEEILRLKKRIYMEMNAAFKQAGKSLKALFSKIDIDDSNKIELDEF